MASTRRDGYTPRTPQTYNFPTVGPTPPLSPVNTLGGSLHVGISPDTPHPPPPSECLHLAMDNEDAFVGVVPCIEHPGMNRRTVFGLRLSTSSAQGGLSVLCGIHFVLISISIIASDLFYHGNKYPDDEPYKEMDENSRFWKTCVDEGMKVDAGKVIDWTDALDVLLVFVSPTRQSFPYILNISLGWIVLCGRLYIRMSNLPNPSG